jgi:hypothetical protein
MIVITEEITFTREEVCSLLNCDPAYQSKEIFTWEETCSLLNSNQ